MSDASNKTIEHEIQAIGHQVFGSDQSYLEGQIIKCFVESGQIDVKGEDFPGWLDDVVDGNVRGKELGIKMLLEWPRGNNVRLHKLLHFLELDLVRHYAKDQVVNIQRALLEASPAQMSVCVSFKLEFQNCRWLGALYIKGLETKEIKFNECRGDLSLKQTTIEGGLEIGGGRIKRVDLDHINCRHLTLINCGCREIWADTLHVKQNIGIVGDTSQFMRACRLTRFEADVCSVKRIKADTIDVSHAQISHRLKIEAKLSKEEDSDPAMGGSLDLTHISVGEELHLAGIVAARNSTIDLTNVTTNILSDGANTWPENGVIRLNGLQYQEIRRLELLDRGSNIVDPKETFPARMKLLDLQSDWNFSLHSYRQLANSYVTQEHRHLAVHTMVEGAEKLRKSKHRGQLSAIWTRIVRTTTGHGYQPELSLRWLGLFFVIGAIVFHLAYSAELMAKTNG